MKTSYTLRELGFEYPLKFKALDRVRVEIINDCWICISHINNTGYPRIGIRYRTWRIHRIILEIKIGNFNPKMALHRCDNKRCLNPEHLYAGDKRDNALDAIRNGKSAVGEQHHRARLTEAQVLEIVEKLRNPYRGIVKSLARQYGVKREAISKIKNKTRWKHITNPQGKG